MSTSLAFAGIDEITAAFRKGSVSAAEISRYFLERLAAGGPALHAIAAIAEKRAMRRARHLDRRQSRSMDRRPLSAVPFGVKDMIETRGVPTRNGSELEMPTRDADAVVVRRLEAAGGVLCAKLAMQEFGGLHTMDPGRGTDGATLNPWDGTRWAGGSSGGSAAAVAAGLVPFALGAESGGSIAFPASYCGISGARPTYGTVSAEGTCVVCWTLDKVGPLARSIADCEIVLRVIRGRPFRPSHAAPGEADAPLRGIRLGFARVDFEEAASEEMRPALVEALASLSDMGASLREVALPDDVPYRQAISVVAIAEVATVMDSAIEARGFTTLSEEQRAGLLANRDLPARDYLNATRIRGVLARRLAEVFGTVDAIVSYVTPWPAPPADQPFRVVPESGGNSGLIAAGNLAGLPAVFLPVGSTPAGLPVGVQIVGRPHAEATLFRIGRAYQRQTGWHLRQPPSLAAVADSTP